MRLFHADIFKHNTSTRLSNLQHDKDLKCGERNILPKRSNKDSFTGDLFCSWTGLIKHHGWRFISYDYVGAEQVLRALIYFVDIITGLLSVLNQLKEPLLQSFVLLWVKWEWYIQRFWLGNLCSTLDFESICGIEISQYFTW